MHNVKERRKKKKLIYLHESVLGKIFKIDQIECYIQSFVNKLILEFFSNKLSNYR